jgi:hypothetical protein
MSGLFAYEKPCCILSSQSTNYQLILKRTPVACVREASSKMSEEHWVTHISSIRSAVPPQMAIHD